MAASSRPPKAAAIAERIVQHAGVPRERAVDDAALARQAVFIDAGAAAGPARAAAAEQCRGDGRRRRGIADAHLAQAERDRMSGETAS